MISKINSQTQDLLRFDDFESADACRIECEARTSPVLLIVDIRQHPEVLDWLENRHDVCLPEAPPHLVQHRLNRLRVQTINDRDPLTGLLSRMAIHEAFQQQCLSATSLSLIFCDIDHFKRLNDAHGHAAGDEVLREVANVLRDTCHEDDRIGRHGGEEFVIVCSRDRESTAELADRIQQNVMNYFSDGFGVTISLGTATATDSDAQDLFAHADEALYSAKASGRNCRVDFADMELASKRDGHDTGVIGLENRTRVLSERVASFISMKSRNLINRIQGQANTDGLTQFFTRRHLDQRLDQEVQSGAAGMTVAFIDLDHFGMVNKHHGWPSGDKILREVCDQIRNQLRATDWVGRYGGEEFCLVMSNTELTDAVAILERLRESIATTRFFSTAGSQVPMTLSIGAVQSRSGESPQQMLERASEQALTAKNSGRNRVCTEARSQQDTISTGT